MTSFQRVGRLGAAATLLALCGLPAVAEDKSQQVEKCPKKLGTLAVVEPQGGWGYLAHYGLGSPAQLLRIMVQQSGCFDVVERGVAMQNLQQERALAAGGELRQESNVGKGQMQVADFVMTPAVQVGSQTTGGVGGALLGRLGGVVGAVLGGLKFKEASTSLTVADVRSSIQVAAAEGQAKKTDFSLGGLGITGGGAGALGGFTNTPEGKVIAASFLDNYNKIVLSIKDNDKLIAPGSVASDANAAASTQAQAPQKAGEMLVPKIANVKLFEQPSRDSKVVATLPRGEQLVASGEVKNGFIYVDAGAGSGWVQRTLVGPGVGGSSPAAAPPPPPAGMPPPPPPDAPGGAPQSTAPLPANLIGMYSGSFKGTDSGVFMVTALANGMLSGQGTSTKAGAFTIGGRVDGAGNFTLAASAGTAPVAVLLGHIEVADGTMTGNWRPASSEAGGGTFTGQRQQ